MVADAARELVAQTPSYEFRSAGKLCVVCGSIVGNVPGDDQVHAQWHAALAALVGGSGPP
ncbi:MAG TPA: hypothetical protein VN748_15445 [Pseudonocardiaceae bacterium]|jgi:hypothetical protein|nr:hypothetical protein [Pseudonocardiaceae bacterium]